MALERNAGKSGIPVYQLHVKLLHSKPMIWRSINVPGNANLGWVHAALQIAMGWTNTHLHHFIVGEDFYSDPAFDLDGNRPVLDERRGKLMELFPSEGHGCFYEYDFGDSWIHLITVAKILPPDAAQVSKASCIGGARACPPEDCGGLPGYMQLLEALKDKKHPEHDTMKEWLGRPFSPAKFDKAKVNEALSRLKWPYVTTSQLRKILMDRDGYKE